MARPFALLVDLRQQYLLRRRIGFVQFFLQYLAGRPDVRQRVVQLMRHAGQQGAQRRQFLGAQQMLLPYFQFLQHVIEGQRDGQDLAVLRWRGKVSRLPAEMAATLSSICCSGCATRRDRA